MMNAVRKGLEVTAETFSISSRLPVWTGGFPNMDMAELGWNATLQDQLDSYGLEDINVGRIYRIDRSEFGVLTADGELSARLSGKLRTFESARDHPTVGDWVLVKTIGKNNTIFAVLDRSSVISRKAPGKVTGEQLIAANVDLVFIVMGLDNDYNLRRLERYLTMVMGARIRPVVILNKTDLMDRGDPRMDEIKEAALGVNVHFISAKAGAGIKGLRRYFKKGVTIVLVGSSGAGKSTIINTLLGFEKQKTSEVRGSDSKGRHVTTRREMFILPEGGIIIDNPGIREVQLWGEPTNMDDAFPDIANLALGCRFKNCQHISEPDCAVKEAVTSKALDGKRYDNYLKMKKEMLNLAMRADKGGETFQRQRWKGIHKGVKQYLSLIHI